MNGAMWQLLIECDACGHRYQESQGVEQHHDGAWEVPDGWDGCPECGHRKISVQLLVAEAMPAPKVSLDIKGRPAGGGRPFYRSKVGDSLHRDTGQWNYVDQVTDEREGRYRKTILDGRTGEVIRKDDMPLREKGQRDRARRRSEE